MHARRLNGLVGGMAATKRRFGWWIALLSCWCLAGAVRGVEMPRELVTSDAQWVLHLDLDALKRTELYRHLQTKGKIGELFQFGLEVDGEQLKLDFTRCQSATFFGGMDDDDEAWVGLVGLPASYRQEVLKSLEKLARKEDGPVERIEENKSWNGFSLDEEVYVYSPRRELLIFGEPDSAEHACTVAARKETNPPARVLDGWDRKSAAFLSLAQRRGDDEDGGLPESMGVFFSLPDALTQAAPGLGDSLPDLLSSASRGMRLSVGEQTNVFWVRLALACTNSAGAVQLHRSLTNLAALATARNTTNAILERVLRRLEIARDGAEVRVFASHPTQVNGRSIYEGVLDSAPSESKTEPAKPLSAQPTSPPRSAPPAKP